MFHGISSLSLDSKGRITVPVKYRPLLVPNGLTYLAIVESNFGCLVMMPHNIWTERTRILLKSGTEIEKRFWIGLSDTAVENNWVWVDGTSMSYNNWSSNQPDNYNNEDCVHIYANSSSDWASGDWNDLQCGLNNWYGDYLNYICETVP